MIKVNDIVYYETPEGLVEVAITQLSFAYATIIWNEKTYNNGCAYITGREAIVPLSKLEEIK